MDVYSYDPSIKPEVRNGFLSLPGNFQFNGFLDRSTLSHINTHSEITVEHYIDEMGHQVFVHRPARIANPPWRHSSYHCRGKELKVQADELICGDHLGTLFLARMLKYRVALVAENPFMYCDYPEKGNCDSNAEVFLLAPLENSSVRRLPRPLMQRLRLTQRSIGDDEPPPLLFPGLLSDAVRCASDKWADLGIRKEMLPCARRVL